MKAQAIFNRRVILGEKIFAELVVWEVPKPLLGSGHPYKYRLALIADGICVLRYDNEAGKGDHKHLGNQEFPYAFSSTAQLVADFWHDVTRWRDENRDI